MRGLVISVVEGAFYALACALAVLIVVAASDVAHSHALLSAALSPEARTESAWLKALETVTLGLYEGAARERVEIAALNARIHLEWQRASHLSWLLFAAAGVFLGIEAMAGRRDPVRLTRAMLVTSTVFLAIGLLAPMLSVVAQREVPVLGQVVLRYESKGIVSTVMTLVERGNPAVALALALFSIVLPVAKLLLGAIGCLTQHRHAARARRLMHRIGQWSMTDVFVVAVLLAFLAGDAGDSTNAWVGHGLWFFAGYAGLSFLASRRLHAVDAPGDA